MAVDLGGEATSDQVEPTVRRFLAAVEGGGARVGEADLVRLRAEGAAAARQGLPLASPIDAYLSTAWVAWDHAQRLAPPPDPSASASLAAALLRAGDDIAAALADGYTAVERALAATAGATRQAILDELLSPGVGGAGGGRAHAAPGGIGGLRRRARLPRAGHPSRLSTRMRPGSWSRSWSGASPAARAAVRTWSRLVARTPWPSPR